MKKILITGKNSYVGTNFEKWLANYPDGYVIDSVSLRNNSWEESDFSNYDVVLHVAGIAHIKETNENASLYYKVNRDLAYAVAKKAKVEGVKQFIFLSSMSVYGINTGVIDENTPLIPKSNYGKSKLQAEELIKSLNEDWFRTAIIRPPMIYGKGCKGNYSILARLAIKSPVFPSIKNKRSMIFIDNLCEFLRLIIDDTADGIFFPQNEDYVCTSEMVKIVAKMNGKNIWLTNLFNPLIGLINLNIIQKIFGDLIYERELSIYGKRYCLYSFIDSIKNSEVK